MNNMGCIYYKELLLTQRQEHCLFLHVVAACFLKDGAALLSRHRLNKKRKQES